MMQSIPHRPHWIDSIKFYKLVDAIVQADNDKERAGKYINLKQYILSKIESWEKRR